MDARAGRGGRRDRRPLADPRAGRVRRAVRSARVVAAGLSRSRPVGDARDRAGTRSISRSGADSGSPWPRHRRRRRSSARAFAIPLVAMALALAAYVVALSVTSWSIDELAAVAVNRLLVHLIVPAACMAGDGPAEDASQQLVLHPVHERSPSRKSPPRGHDLPRLPEESRRRRDHARAVAGGIGTW